VDGLYAWSPTGWARFPNAVKARIAVFATTNDGHVLDVEQGNATPAESVDWVLGRRRAGIDPTVYMNTSTWPTVRAAFQARGITEPHYWVAQYDGLAVIPAGAVGKQYYNNDTLGYDLSTFPDYWPGVDQQPPYNQAPREDNMHIDLELNKAVVFTNPAAVIGGVSKLTLASDFGDAMVRVAVFSFKADGWSVLPLVAVGRTAGAWVLDMPPDTNKVSVMQTGLAGQTVGLDVIA
jgi:hypothetical protein